MPRPIHVNHPADWERLQPGDFMVFVCVPEGKACFGDETM
jgi:hypothetical protein